MEQYPVPQFIEQEARIAFNITFSQFFYILGGGVICFFLYYLLPRTIFYVAAFIVGATSLGLGFLNINGAPLASILLASLGFATGGKNYTWKKKESPYPFKSIKRTPVRKIEQKPVLRAQESQLRRVKTSVELKTR